MDAIDILAVAARNYLILDYLSTGDFGYPELVTATSIPRSTLGKYIEEMEELGLVEVEKKSSAIRSEVTIKITKLGSYTLNHIKKYEKYVTRLTTGEETKEQLSDILSLLGNSEIKKEIREELFNKLAELCRSNPEIIADPGLQNYIEQYIENKRVDRGVDNFLHHCVIKNAIQNIELNGWFYNKIYPKLNEQFMDASLEEAIRVSRVRLLWEIVRLDEEKRIDVLRPIIQIFEKECMDSESELCKIIRTSYAPNLKLDLISRFSIMGVKKEFINKFF